MTNADNSTASSTGARCDVAVLGGGVVGLSVSNALLRAGLTVRSIYPVDSRARPTASRAAGAMLGAFGEVTMDDGGVDDPAFRFRLAAQRMHPDWLRDICARAGSPVQVAAGTFVLANNVGAGDRANVRQMKMRADYVGEPAEYIDPQDVPGLTPSQYQAPGLCLRLPKENAVDADQLLAALAASASSFAGWSHVADTALAVRPREDGWMVLTTGGAQLRARHVVLAAGSRSWEVLTEELREAAGLPELSFGKGVSCLVRGAPVIPSTIRTPNRSFACGIHVLPRADGLLYLGATNNPGVDHEAAQGIQPGELHTLFDAVIHEINTDIRESQIVDMRVGYRPIVSHGRPVIGATALPGMSVATGTYRDGVLMAPLIARIVAAEILGRPVDNPFPATATGATRSRDELVRLGVRDIVAFLQEPRGELPYDRAEQLTRYVTTLFEMAVDGDNRYADVRADITRRLEEVPLTETMHTIFRAVIDLDASAAPETANPEPR